MALVTIGAQTWTVENLDVDSFRDGTPIAIASSSRQWEQYAASGTPACCYYDFDSSNSRTYGRLYNWYAVSASQELAPTGFRIPEKSDWDTLISTLGGERSAGLAMKNIQNWISLTRANPNGTNSSGFTGNPGGFIRDNGQFYDFGFSGNFWADTTSSAATAYSYKLYWENNNAISISRTPLTIGLSVRLLVSGSESFSGDYNPSEPYQ